MKKQFVTYPIALALKELRFNEPCSRYVFTGNTGVNVDFVNDTLSILAKNYNDSDLSVSIPLWQQVIDWFEERYIYISFFKVGTGSDEWEIAYSIEYLPKEVWEEKRRALSFKRIDSFKEGPSSYSGAWRTSYEARKAAVLEAIEIFKKENYE